MRGNAQSKPAESPDLANPALAIRPGEGWLCGVTARGSAALYGELGQVNHEWEQIEDAWIRFDKEDEMAGLAHAGVGLAAKRIAPKAPLGVLLLGAYAIDIVWGVFFVAGIERLPKPGRAATNPWSHGLFMSVNWSLIAALIAKLISGNLRTSVLCGLLVFSHWVVDCISKPMSAVFPDDTGLPLFFDGSPTVGLGLYRSKIGANVAEYGTLFIGIVIYILTLSKLKKESELLAQEPAGSSS